MKFQYSGLTLINKIFTISIFLFFAYLGAFAQEVVKSTAAVEEKPAVEEKKVAEQPPERPKAKTTDEKIESLLSSLIILEEANDNLQRRLDNFSIELSSAIERISLLARYYAELYKKLEDLSVQLNDLKSERSPTEMTKPVTSAEKKQDTPRPSILSQEVDSGGQYVRLRIKDKNQDLEFQVDPTYVDMNLEMKRQKEETPAQQTPVQEKVEKSPTPQPAESETEKEKRMLDYIARTLKTMEKPRRDAPREVDRDVLSDLIAAQKLVNKRQYNQALRLVQRSLTKQETAVGYALEGSIYFLLGDIEFAIRSWQEALNLDPNMTDVRDALNRYSR